MKDLLIETLTAVTLSSNSVTGSLENPESSQNKLDCAIFITSSFKLAAILTGTKDMSYFHLLM